MKRFIALGQTSRRRVGNILLGACLGVLVLGDGMAAWGQDKALPPGDVIQARKTLMSVIARNMYPLDEMVYTGKINLPRGRGHADSIAAMLQAFPLLFPAHTNAYKPGTADPASATFADPHIWDQFDFFYKETMTAAKYAFDASSRRKRDAIQEKRHGIAPDLRRLPRHVPEEQLMTR